MLAGLMFIGGFCLVVGVVYPICCAIYWVLFRRGKESLWEFMRDC